ncbi:hypothetical protein GIB67_010156, partial [Kingdonia uniflora]
GRPSSRTSSVFVLCEGGLRQGLPQLSNFVFTSKNDFRIVRGWPTSRTPRISYFVRTAYVKDVLGFRA